MFFRVILEKNQPSVFNKILKSPSLCSGWFQNFIKNLGLIFSQITLKNMWLLVLITWLCEINLSSLYKHRVFLVKSTGTFNNIITTNRMFERAIWDKSPECIFENFEISQQLSHTHDTNSFKVFFWQQRKSSSSHFHKTILKNA